MSVNCNYLSCFLSGVCSGHGNPAYNQPADEEYYYVPSQPADSTTQLGMFLSNQEMLLALVIVGIGFMLVMVFVFNK